MSDGERTQIGSLLRDIDLVAGDRLHCLELIDTEGMDRRHIVGPLGAKVGRMPPADIVLVDSEVSRSHCFISLERGELVVSDLRSTNGTYIDGERVEGDVILPVGSMLQVGKHMLRHELRSRAEIDQSDDLDRELERASNYVQALLPPPTQDGPVRCDWIHMPCARLGGDAFGYGRLSDNQFVAYILDVAGHGAGAAMLAVSVMSQLRQRTLPDCDMRCPAQVLGTLNRLFQMDDQAGLFFTMWYGVYDTSTRSLEFASAGHHDAFLVPRGTRSATRVGNRNTVIGAIPGMGYNKSSIEVPQGSTMYLFSDGVFEITDKTGKQWSIADFEQVVCEPAPNGCREAERLFHAVRSAAQAGPLEDDFSLVVAHFD